MAKDEEDSQGWQIAILSGADLLTYTQNLILFRTPASALFRVALRWTSEEKRKRVLRAEERNEDLDWIRGQLDRLATDKNQMAFSGRHTKRTD